MLTTEISLIQDRLAYLREQRANQFLSHIKIGVATNREQYALAKEYEMLLSNYKKLINENKIN